MLSATFTVCWQGANVSGGKEKGTYVHVSLTPFFLTLVCLKLGLLERDLADTFGILQALVSMTFNTWLNLTTCHLKNSG